MNDHAIKKRLARARKLATGDLARAGYGIIEAQNEPFSFIGVRPSEARFIRIALDEATPTDINSCKRFKVPSNCTREIWALPGRGRCFRVSSV